MSFLNNKKWHKSPYLDLLYHIFQSSFVRQCTLHTSLVLRQTHATFLQEYLRNQVITKLFIQKMCNKTIHVCLMIYYHLTHCKIEAGLQITIQG